MHAVLRCQNQSGGQQKAAVIATNDTRQEDMKCRSVCSEAEIPPYSAMAIAQWMPPKNDAMLAPYATCNKAAFCTSSAGNSGKLAAIGGDRAMKGITPAQQDDITVHGGKAA